MGLDTLEFTNCLPFQNLKTFYKYFFDSITSFSCIFEVVYSK